MVDVEEVYKLCVEGLLEDSREGYIDNDQFNRISVLAEGMLFRYFISLPDNRDKSSALGVFRKQSDIVDGKLPADFRHRITTHVGKVGDNGVEFVFAREYVDNEVSVTEENSIRGSSDSKFRVQIVGKNIKVYPTNYDGVIRLVYYRNPDYANRVVEYDAGNDVYNYDPASSKHYEWNDFVRDKLVSFILYFLGVEVRDPSIINFLKAIA